MLSILLFLGSFASLLLHVSGTAIHRRDDLICSAIAAKISGDVYYPLSLGVSYVNAIDHYMTSSSETPLCVVEVANPQDVSEILKLVGPSRTPFAVKSGGHASNPGFSSTSGVQISLVRLKQVDPSPDRKTVEIGFGNLWTDVYTALDGTSVNIVGGRVSGPGVGGFTLGGGYSWKSNQYGLTCDTIVSYSLVLPNGTITTVSSSTPDLFFALKGGLNRFGIVTSAIFQTHPQPQLVYGGIQLFAGDKIPALVAATQSFQTNNKDPKAQVILTINGGAASTAILLLFYDGPSRPAAFNPYNGIPAVLDTVKSQSYASFATSTPVALSSGNRGAFATLSTTGLTAPFMSAVFNESLSYGPLSVLHSGILLSYDIEPFMKYGKHATDSAYPHADSPLPLNLYFAWKSEPDDSFWRAEMQASLDRLRDVARKDGIYKEGSVAYPNYALDTSTGTQIYGGNAARLRGIRDRIDPQGVMLLAGGFEL